jgi:hypothetical protein
MLARRPVKTGGSRRAGAASRARPVSDTSALMPSADVLDVASPRSRLTRSSAVRDAALSARSAPGHGGDYDPDLAHRGPSPGRHSHGGTDVRDFSPLAAGDAVRSVWPAPHGAGAHGRPSFGHPAEPINVDATNQKSGHRPAAPDHRGR